jgi:hypothetical protein
MPAATTLKRSGFLNPKADMLRYAERLRTFVLPEGGFPYCKYEEAFAEPTLLALLAFKAAGRAQNLSAPSLSWLLSVRNGDGSTGLNPDQRNQGLWLTAQSAVVFHHYGLSAPFEDAIRRLIHTRSALSPEDQRISQNNSLVGWPWVRGTFGWVEPTAWALIALGFHGSEEHPRAVEGRNLLLDRRISSGGWNYGNREIRRHRLLPFVDTTALALLALRGHAAQNILESSLDYLEGPDGARDSVYDLAWTVIGLEAFGRNASPWKERLAVLTDSIDDDKINAAHLALAVIALSGERMLVP